MKAAFVFVSMILAVITCAGENFCVDQDPSSVLLKYTMAGKEYVILSITKNEQPQLIQDITLRVNGHRVRVDKRLYEDLRNPLLGSTTLCVGDDGTVFIAFRVYRKDNGTTLAKVTLLYHPGGHIERVLANELAATSLTPPPTQLMGTVLAQSCSEGSLLVNFGTAERAKPTRVVISQTTAIFSQHGGRLGCGDLSFNTVYVWPAARDLPTSDSPINATAILVAD